MAEIYRFTIQFHDTLQFKSSTKTQKTCIVTAEVVKSRSSAKFIHYAINLPNISFMKLIWSELISNRLQIHTYQWLISSSTLVNQPVLHSFETTSDNMQNVRYLTCAITFRTNWLVLLTWMYRMWELIISTVDVPCWNSDV